MESRCSGWAVDARIRRACARDAKRLLSQLTAGAPGGEARFLAAAFRAGDPIARKILDDVATDLAFGLSHAVQLFHPSMIVLGGGLSLVGQPLRAAVARALRPFVMEAFAPGPRVALSSLREDAVPVGALENARALVESRPKRATENFVKNEP